MTQMKWQKTQLNNLFQQLIKNQKSFGSRLPKGSNFLLAYFFL